MTHPTNDYHDAHPPSDHGDAAPTMNGNVGPTDIAFIRNVQPANENVLPHIPLVREAFEASTEERFHIATSEKLDDPHGFYPTGADAYETMSNAVRESLEEFAAGIGQFNSKLMEFGQVNARNNVAFVQNVAGIRNVREAVDVQTAYLREQLDAATTQLSELQALTTEIAEKAAAPLKQQFMRSTQMFRSC